MKKRYIVLIAVAVLLVIAVIFFAQVTTIYSTQVVAKEAGSGIGIAPFTDRVDFGDIPVGSGITKVITLENNGSIANNIKVLLMGSISSFIKVKPKSFTLEAGENQDIELEIYVPASAKPGQKFSGRIIILKLPKGLW